MLSQNLNSLKPRKPLGLGLQDLPHVGDLNKDFFITVGCSFTQGSYIDYTDTWSHRLGKMLNMEHLNIAFEGSSLEYQYELIKKVSLLYPDNTILWMQTFPVRTHRWFMAPIAGDRLARKVFDKTWDDPASWRKILKYVELAKDHKVYMTNCWGYNTKIKVLLENKICNHNRNYFFNPDEPVDKGLDDVHPGKESHRILAEKWYDHLTKHFTNSFSNK